MDLPTERFYACDEAINLAILAKAKAYAPGNLCLATSFVQAVSHGRWLVCRGRVCPLKSACVGQSEARYRVESDAKRELTLYAFWYLFHLHPTDGYPVLLHDFVVLLTAWLQRRAYDLANGNESDREDLVQTSAYNVLAAIRSRRLRLKHPKSVLALAKTILWREAVKLWNQGTIPSIDEDRESTGSLQIVDYRELRPEDAARMAEVESAWEQALADCPVKIESRSRKLITPRQLIDSYVECGWLGAKVARKLNLSARTCQVKLRKVVDWLQLRVPFLPDHLLRPRKTKD